MNYTVIDQWREKAEPASNYLYQFENGVRLLSSSTPTSKDAFIEIIFEGGSYSDYLLNLPSGTAHMMEHVLCSPNKVLKTEQELNEFKFGTKKRPQIYTNASTYRNKVAIYGECHIDGFDRLVDYLSFQLDRDESSFAENIEKERKIILAEFQRLLPEDKDPSMAYAKFFYDPMYPNISNNIIGNDESIRAINVKNLKKSYDHHVRSENTIISIYTPKHLTQSQLKKISQIVEKIPIGKPDIKTNHVEYKPEFKFKHFENDRVKGVFFSLNFFTNKPYSLSYEEGVRSFLSRQLISYVGQKILREEKHLVYGVKPFSEVSIARLWNRGISIEFETVNAPVIFDELALLMESTVLDFLKTTEGENWLKGEISKYIFRRTKNLYESYAFNIACDILHGDFDYKYQYEKSIAAAKKVTVMDLINSYVTIFKNSTPAAWFQSATNGEGLIEQFKSSKLFKLYNS